MISPRKISMDILYVNIFLQPGCSSVCENQLFFFFFLLALALTTDLLGLLRETKQKQSFVQLLSLTLLADWIHLQHFHPNNHQLV